jgi:hypothetical protein
VSQPRRAHRQPSGAEIATPDFHRDDPIVRASEVGHYVFCRRAWWLARVLGCQPDDLSGLRDGIQFHNRLGRSVGAAQRWQRIAYVLIGLGLAVGILTFLGSCGVAAQ